MQQLSMRQCLLSSQRPGSSHHYGRLYKCRVRPATHSVSDRCASCSSIISAGCARHVRPQTVYKLASLCPRASNMASSVCLMLAQPRPVLLSAQTSHNKPPVKSLHMDNYVNRLRLSSQRSYLFTTSKMQYRQDLKTCTALRHIVQRQYCLAHSANGSLLQWCVGCANFIDYNSLRAD